MPQPIKESVIFVIRHYQPKTFKQLESLLEQKRTSSPDAIKPEPASTRKLAEALFEIASYHEKVTVKR